MMSYNLQNLAELFFWMCILDLFHIVMAVWTLLWDSLGLSRPEKKQTNKQTLEADQFPESATVMHLARMLVYVSDHAN